MVIEVGDRVYDKKISTSWRCGKSYWNALYKI